MANGAVAAVASLGGGPRLGLYVPEDPEHIAWATAYDLGLGGRWRRAFGGADLSVSLMASAVGVVSRPPLYTTRNNDKPQLGYILAQAHGGLEVATWPEHGVGALAVEWRQPWTSWFSTFAFELRYERFAEPAEMELLDCRLVTGFGFGS